MRARFETRPWILLAAAALAACSGEPAEPPPPEAPAAGTPDPAQAELPPGHPPIPTPAPESRIVPPPPGSGTGETALSWTVPAGWISEPPSSAMRRAQYRLPGAAGDAECVVFYFGPGQGGGAESNARRWAEQFRGSDGDSPGLLDTESLEVGGIPVSRVRVTGTYRGGTMGGPAEDLPDHMLLGAIAGGADANWFFKCTGPEATLRSHQEAFDGMIQSLSRGE